MATNDYDAIAGFLSKNDKVMMRETVNNLDIVKDLSRFGSVIRNLKSEKNLLKLTVGNGVRPLNTDIEEAKHQRKWGKRVITPRFGMKIFHVIPDEARDTYISEMHDLGAKYEPFAPWVWQQEFAKLGEELNNNSYLSEFKSDAGDYDAGAAYSVGDVVYFTTDKIFYKCTTAAAAGESPLTNPEKWIDVDNQVLCDGPGTIIANELAASNDFSAVVTGTYDQTNAVAAYREVWGGFDEAHKSAGGYKVMFVSFDSFEDYMEDYNTRYGTGKSIGGVDIGETTRPFLKNSGGRCLIMPVTWMGASRRIICTSQKNLTLGVNTLSDTNTTSNKVDTLHGYKAVSKFTLSFQIRDLEHVSVNDQL